MDDIVVQVLIMLVQVVVLVLAISTGFAYLTLFERRLLARMQNRVGPNRAGPGGFLQPAADAVKLFFKEDVIPTLVDRGVYLLAPALAVIPALLIWAVIPFGCLNIAGDYQACFADPATNPNLHNIFQLADIDIGVLYLLAITSIGVYGITLAGWASNSKYAMLGGIRASAQLISYELALSSAVLAAVMMAGTLSTHEVIYQQMTMWFVIPQLLGFVLFLISGTAELVRAPFDLVEAEQELTSGYNAEYGSMKFALFFMSEYIKMIAISAIAVTLYLGGWNAPGLELLGSLMTGMAGPLVGSIAVGLASFLVFLVKVVLILFLFVWMRASWPRVRYDKLMYMGWKWLLPLALLNVAMTAVFVVVLPDALIHSVALFVASLVVMAVAYVVSSRVKPAPSRSRIKMVQPEVPRRPSS
ncbi:MAG: NADH-quinone oxidoreductase subunit NuoH [Chloroflexaceae bacterium]|nr:NADH-quinone oxidoreductase subunit NuoH [Chloroflexaceae bacterium]